MRLNHDCVRDLMLLSEENLNMSNYIRCSCIHSEQYTCEELVYTASKLIEAGYLKGDFLSSSAGKRDTIISSITWSGHEFLDNIRDDGVWKITKDKLSKFSSVSISIISKVATQVITNLINNQLGL